MRKSRFQGIALVALLSCFVSADGLNAQVAVGVGVYSGPRYPRYPYFGAYPLNYPGFYGNGMSLYGPPVPTYGSIPGTFGAADNRVIQNGPAFGGAIGVYTTFPRSRSRGHDAEAVQPAPAADALMVEVRVPLENAIVFVNEQVTKQNGQVRYYSSPSLTTSENYRYTVRAVWTIDGKHNDRTVVVEGKPGERLLADFTH